MLWYFGLSLFVSATLLFLVQPMIGKMILPQLGGTPAVWNTCMVFFQGVLLIGYGYTHLLTTSLLTRGQILIHGFMLLLPFLVLPFSLGDWMPPTDSNPIYALMVKLTIMVGLPFFAVSTTAPLLQRWFIHTDDPAAKDPYFLYGASNFGSMLGLALYPTVIEPWLPVTPAEGESEYQTQVYLWTAGYAVFVALVVGCAVIVWQALARMVGLPARSTSLHESPLQPPPAPVHGSEITAGSPKRIARSESGARTKTTLHSKSPAENDTLITRFLNWYFAKQHDHAYDIAVREHRRSVTAMPEGNVTWWRRLRWIGLAAAPSSLMLGVTTYMTTDIAAVAFFWIIPLALYLLTFILVFARWPVVWTGTPHTVVMFLQPCFLLFLVLKIIGQLAPPPFWEFALHLGAFFTTTLMCHGELAKDRPGTKHLTEFYFWMSLGGVLGGLFNALFAPVVFQYGIWEYPIAMAFACLLRSNLVEDVTPMIPGDSTAVRSTPFGYTLDLIIPLAIGATTYFIAYLCIKYYDTFFLLERRYLLAIMVIIVLALSLRPVRFGLSVAALFIGAGAFDRIHDPLLYEQRGFFGLLRVREQHVGWEDMPTLKEDEKPQRQWKVYRELIHGGINHGRQIVQFKYGDDQEIKALTLNKRREPITYFHERNGVAEIYGKFSWPDWRLPVSMVGFMGGDCAALAMLANTQSEPPYAVLGLGTGILAAYAKPYQTVHFYEIDPLVKEMSIVPGYAPPWKEKERAAMSDKLPEPIFYYVYDAQERWSNIDVILGDGRLKIKEAPENYYHIISLDAFSSDAIPVHLLTAQAVDLYMSKLVEGGVLIFNSTNLYVRIEGVLSAIAEEKGYNCLSCADYGYNPKKYPNNKDHPDRYHADWVVLQRPITKQSYRNGGPPIDIRLDKVRKRLSWDGRVLLDKDGEEIMEKRWKAVPPLPGPIWTDSYSNLLRIMQWR